MKVVFGWFFALLIIANLSIRWNNNLTVKTPFVYLEPINSFFRFELDSVPEDWHDYETIEREAKRTGPGEQGAAVYVSKDDEVLNGKILKESRHNEVVSDMIARDRAIPDTRPQRCQQRKYLRDLPSVSVVIPFYNEILSTLTRTIHSVFNRSPPDLLLEVIIVNNHSDKKHTYGSLEEYLSKHFDKEKLRLIVMPKKSGLVQARIAGAQNASGDVLVFLNCHTEVNVNWLPPLLEPIAMNYRTCTCPYVDVITADTYQYNQTSVGSRGVFSWKTFKYVLLPLRPGDQLSEDQNFETPVMMGRSFDDVLFLVI